jgi:NAD(P)-dependent dehydrogenase (short-subunit alcohol dehydrogenase family)
MTASPYPDLQGRVALVTGAASGIGLAVARRLGQAGCRVAMADIAADRLETAVVALRDLGIDTQSFVADLSQPDQVEALVAGVVRQFGGLNLAVNNAGVSGVQAAVAEQPLEAWHRVIDQNLNSVFYSMKYEIPALLAAPGGAIVNVASVLAQVGSALAPAYTAAKHGVLGLTRSAALAYAPQGLRINAVGPGYIRTPLLEVLEDAALKRVTAAQPLGRLGEPDEIADLIVFLLSSRASFTTGALYLADGGLTAA